MPRIAVLVGLVVAACNGGEGVDLEITSETSFDRVELFIATGECFENGKLCEDGVAWMPDEPRPPGDVYYMAGGTYGPGRLVSTTTFVGDTAVMHLEATSEFRQPKLIVVVGFVGETAVAYASLPYSTRIPAHSSEVWRVKLQKAAPATTNVTTPPAESESQLRVHAWKRERIDNADQLSRCLALQSWNESSKVWDGLFIVPESDPDCDGHEIECDDRFANFNTSAAPTRCIGPTMPAPLTREVCALGSATCGDGVSADATCTHDAALICAPQEVCNDCSGAGAVDTCAATSIRGNSAVGHVKCELEPDASTGGPCPTGGPGSHAQMILPMPCDSVSVHSLSDPFSNTGPSSTALVGAASVQIVADYSDSGSCRVEVKWTTGTAQVGEHGWFVLAIGSPLTANTVLVPLELSFSATADCAMQVTIVPQCALNGGLVDDPMFDCAGRLP